jgi:hypothetical protein
MARRGGSIYISTNPLDNVPIGIAGQGISIGPMGTLIFSDSEQVPGFMLVTESSGTSIVTESAGDIIITENPI